MEKKIMKNKINLAEKKKINLARKNKIKLTKRKMDVLEHALTSYRYGTRLSVECVAMCDELCELLYSMYKAAPRHKEAKMRFSSSEALLLESALKFNYEELFDLYKQVKEARDDASLKGVMN